MEHAQYQDTKRPRFEHYGGRSKMRGGGRNAGRGRRRVAGKVTEDVLPMYKESMSRDPWLNLQTDLVRKGLLDSSQGCADFGHFRNTSKPSNTTEDRSELSIDF